MKLITKYRNGFTLIEVLIAVMLVGLAIASLIAANISFTQANRAGTDLSIAEFLLEQLRERTALVGYDDLYGFDDVSFSPPQDANGEDLIDFAAFSQHITVENISDANIGTYMHRCVSETLSQDYCILRKSGIFY